MRGKNGEGGVGNSPAVPPRIAELSCNLEEPPSRTGREHGSFGTMVQDDPPQGMAAFRIGAAAWACSSIQL